MIKQKLLDFGITCTIYCLFGMLVHQWSHLCVAQLMGVQGYVRYEWMFGGEFWATSWHPQGWIILLSGGLGSAIVLGLLWWRARVSPTKWDLDDESMLALWGLTQLGQAIAELRIGFPDYPLIMVCAAGSATFIWLCCYMSSILDWLLEE